MKGSLAFAFGIALLSLGLASINAHVMNTQVLSKELSLNVPPTVYGELELIENATNVSAYVEVVHNGEKSIVKLDSVIPLTPGEWVILPYQELYSMNVTKVINVTESLSCGNVTVQKVIHEEKLVESRNATYPIYVKMSVTRMNLVENPSLVEALGLVLTVLGLTTMLFERARRP
ncbi:MAG: hypothetical protein MPF33_02290 [Candidatus Aramenus sp.]|jgi:hypothetical protein|nr:hypothetical protein [Candidatus Aramenus sp.]